MNLQNNIVGVDPSFSRTGCSFVSQDKIETFSISAPGGVYQVNTCLQSAKEIAGDFKLKFQGKCMIDETLKGSVLFYEYPVLASRSGAYLAMLLSKFDSVFRILIRQGYLKEVYYLPPTAISAYTGILRKDKPAVVEFVQREVGIKCNHDEASSIVLMMIGQDILKGKYKKSKFKL